MLNKSRGFTLPEILVSVTIIVIAAAVTIQQIKPVLSEQDLQAAVQQHQEVSTVLRSCWFPNHNFSYFNLDNSGFITECASSLESGGAMRHIWGGAVTVQPGTSNILAMTTWTNVPEDQCLPLLYATSKTVYRIVLNTTTVLSPGASLDVPLASSRCSLSNTITWEST